MIKQEKTQYNLAQQNPSAFFQELKHRLITYQSKNRLIDDDPVAILDRQIAKTIDDADNYLFEPFKRHDSGVGTDISEKLVYSSFNDDENLCSRNYESSINVIWYPSLDSTNALLSTIPHVQNQLTFKQFRQLFKKQSSYRYDIFSFS
jgi:hypothetical protein